jgi:polar amino acid transport system substrate-binding protein
LKKPINPTIPATLLQSLAPTGRLRASINLGNPILANRDPVSGAPVGISVDMAQAFADQLGLPLELVLFDSAGKSVDAVKSERADIGFFAIDPLRGEDIAFTAPYVVIEGCYLVRNDSPIQRNEDVDRSPNRVVVGMGSAYDLYLRRASIGQFDARTHFPHCHRYVCDPGA